MWQRCSRVVLRGERRAMVHRREVRRRAGVAQRRCHARQEGPRRGRHGGGSGMGRGRSGWRRRRHPLGRRCCHAEARPEGPRRRCFAPRTSQGHARASRVDVHGDRVELGRQRAWRTADIPGTRGRADQRWRGGAHRVDIHGYPLGLSRGHRPDQGVQRRVCRCAQAVGGAARCLRNPGVHARHHAPRPEGVTSSLPLQYRELPRRVRGQSALLQ